MVVPACAGKAMIRAMQSKMNGNVAKSMKLHSMVSTGLETLEKIIYVDGFTFCDTSFLFCAEKMNGLSFCFSHYTRLRWNS